MNARIKPIEAPYSPEIQADFDIIMPPGMPPLGIFKTVANNPRVLQRMVRGGLLDKGSISIGDRELVILRTCGLCKAEYEWGVHVAAFSHQAKLSEQQVQDTLQAHIDIALWSEPQRAVLALVDQLFLHKTVDGILWAEISQHYEADQIIELIMLTGLYHAVSFMVNATQVEREPFAPAFPD